MSTYAQAVERVLDFYLLYLWQKHVNNIILPSHVFYPVVIELNNSSMLSSIINMYQHTIGFFLIFLGTLSFMIIVEGGIFVLPAIPWNEKCHIFEVWTLRRLCNVESLSNPSPTKFCVQEFSYFENNKVNIKNLVLPIDFMISFNTFNLTYAPVKSGQPQFEKAYLLHQQYEGCLDLSQRNYEGCASLSHRDSEDCPSTQKCIKFVLV